MIRRGIPSHAAFVPQFPNYPMLSVMNQWKSILVSAMSALLLSTTACVNQTLIAKERGLDEYSFAIDHQTIVSPLRIVAYLPGPDRLKVVWASKDELEDAAKAAAARIQDDFDHNRTGYWCFSYRPKKGTCHSDSLIVEYQIPFFPKVWNNRATRIVQPIKDAWDRVITYRHGTRAMEMAQQKGAIAPSPPPETQPHGDGEICTQEYQYLTGLDGQTSWILWGKLCVPSCDAPMTRCHWVQLDQGVGFPP